MGSDPPAPGPHTTLGCVSYQSLPCAPVGACHGAGEHHWSMTVLNRVTGHILHEMYSSSFASIVSSQTNVLHEYFVTHFTFSVTVEICIVVNNEIKLQFYSNQHWIKDICLLFLHPASLSDLFHYHWVIRNLPCLMYMYFWCLNLYEEGGLEFRVYWNFKWLNL